MPAIGSIILRVLDIVIFAFIYHISSSDELKFLLKSLKEKGRIKLPVMNQLNCLNDFVSGAQCSVGLQRYDVTDMLHWTEQDRL